MRIHELVSNDTLDESWKHVAGAAALTLGNLIGSSSLEMGNLPDNIIDQIKNSAAALLSTSNPQLEKYMQRVAFDSGIRGIELAQFLAQCAHESLGFSRLVERGSDEYIMKRYDPKYSPSRAEVLGNVMQGDGLKYKGRGFIQLTGRYNYTKAEKALGLPLVDNPELAAKPEVAAKIALWYWNTRVKPKVSDFSDTASVTQKINSAGKGLADRKKKFAAYLKSMVAKTNK